MSRRASVPRAFAVSCLTMIAATAVHAQGLVSTTGAALSIAAPTEAEYSGGASSATRTYTVATTCTGKGTSGCRLFLQYGTNPQGQQLDMEYAIVSLGRKKSCENAVANPSAWFPVQSTTAVLTTGKNRKCVAAFQFRISPLSWTAYQSPGPPGGAYRQQVHFLFTRP